MANPDESDQPPPPSITGAAFWALMTRWNVPDATALRLIDGPPLSRTGGRPRFRLQGEQLAAYELLRAIDRHLEDLGAGPAWLNRPNPAKPFARKPPLAYMQADPPATIAETLRVLEREAFKASLDR